MEAALARGMRPVFTAVQRRFGLRGWGWGGFFGDGGLWGRRRGCRFMLDLLIYNFLAKNSVYPQPSALHRTNHVS